MTDESIPLKHSDAGEGCRRDTLHRTLWRAGGGMRSMDQETWADGDRLFPPIWAGSRNWRVSVVGP